MVKREKTQVCIGCLCLNILCLSAIGYSKRLCVLWERGGVYFIFLGIKNWVSYEKLENKNLFLYLIKNCLALRIEQKSLYLSKSWFNLKLFLHQNFPLRYFNLTRLTGFVVDALDGQRSYPGEQKANLGLLFF